MKKMLLITLLIIAVPSFFVLFIYKEETILKEVVNEVSKEVPNEINDIYIRVKQINKNKIIELDIEDYVMGVLAGEVPIYFNTEALKAQAVAARTYAVRRINKNNDYDVVDTVMNQVYLDNDTLKERWSNNYDAYLNKIKYAVSSTKGEYVDYNGSYADTLFFSTSSGKTENSEEVFGTKVSYLQSVSSTWDEEESPVYEEVNTFTKKEFCNTLNITCDGIKVEIISKTSGGKIKQIKINSKIFTGNDIVSYFRLRSNCFTINVKSDTVSIITKGFGHGVGMSQYGANGMANNGYNYEEILEHYYQGTTIKNLYE